LKAGNVQTAHMQQQKLAAWGQGSPGGTGVWRGSNEMWHWEKSAWQILTWLHGLQRI